MKRKPALTPTTFACTLLALSSFGCSSDSGLAPDPGPPEIVGNAVAGLEAFEAECASCHSSKDGFDLRFFSFPDSTIVRRAVAHVDTATSHDIVAYIRTLRSRAMPRDFRLFQPGDKRAGSDAVFAAGVFGGDWFPADLTASQLLAVDPLEAPIAIDFPLWSFEFSNLDWMPDRPIADELLDFQTQLGAARPYVELYHRTHALDALINGVLALRIAERDPANPDAPCVMEPFDRFRPDDCFEARRWIASLAAQHMLRTGDREALSPILHDGWWDVGNAARRSRQTSEPVDNAIANWAQWMYVGWAFEPDRHASIYLGLAMDALGLPRHSTFHAVRAMVERPANSRAAFMDVRSAARFAPSHWTYNAIRFGYGQLIDRLGSPIRWRDQNDLDEARRAVSDAYIIAARKLSDQSQLAALASLRDQVLNGLDSVTITGG